MNKIGNDSNNSKIPVVILRLSNLHYQSKYNSNLDSKDLVDSCLSHFLNRFALFLIKVSLFLPKTCFKPKGVNC